MILRVIAVDDEALALRRVEILLKRIPDVELVGAAQDGQTAIDLVHKFKPDVLLLDIQMSGFNGFDVVEAIAELVVPRVIFVTAFDTFASRAFEVSAADYVLKPIELDRLREALEKVRRSLRLEDAESQNMELHQVIAALRAQAPSRGGGPGEKEVWAEKRGRLVPVSVSDIIWIEADRDYVRLHTSEDSFLLREAIGNMENRLSSELFLRVRRSAVVRRDKIVAIRRAGAGDYRVQLINGEEVRTGRTYLTALRSLLSRGL